MKTSEINNILRHNPYTRKYFIGTFAANKCPKKPIPNTCFVSNTHPNTLPGQHWIAIYVKRDGNLYYFDPYGIPPFSIYHATLMKKSSDGHGTYNRKQVQTLYSSTCGAHCINFLIASCRNQDPQYTMTNLIRLPVNFLDRLTSQGSTYQNTSRRTGVKL